ncbi:unnamed protein product [Cylindrotheca closterium]|uniref:Protein kinase domain-containing protein n=1 Tax=Cylindrotheca closterium TaxID=2856 RepID=A0AAD2CJM9_9STRA|nr:unnamed protein product [Cylindrotheca closterium]
MEETNTKVVNKNEEEQEMRKHVRHMGFRRVPRRNEESGKVEWKSQRILFQQIRYTGFQRNPSVTTKKSKKEPKKGTKDKTDNDNGHDSDDDKGLTVAKIRNSFMSPGGQPRPALLKKDLSSYFERGDSKSRLSLIVNDSAANKTFDECYEKEDYLGEGGFAVVHRCKHKERGNLYAVKEIQNEGYEDAEGNSFKEEINTMKKLREIPYIVRLLDVFYAYDRTFIIMEEMNGGDLLDKIAEKEYYPEAECRRLARRLFEAIYYCHKKRIVHRDIKPENILLENKFDDTKIKLADFGCAKELEEDTVLVTMCGTPQYVAPEIYLQRSGYDEKCDLWSAAVVVYLLLAGYVPFDGEPIEMHKIVCAGEYEFHPKYWSEISEAPKKLIRDLLKVDPVERATIVQILDTGWLKRLDREKAMLRRNSESDLMKSRSMNQSLRNFGKLSIANLNSIEE